MLPTALPTYRKFPLSPTWGGAWFTVAFKIQRGNNIEAVSPLIIDYKKRSDNRISLLLRVIGSASVRPAL
jgi:hypothetical protein